jgi:hypothetical protein
MTTITAENKRQAELWNHIDSDNNNVDNNKSSETGFHSSNNNDFDQEIDSDLDTANKNIV